MAVRTESAQRPAPSEPEAFIARAQQITNDRDVEAVREVFAPDAEWTIVIDGTVLSAHGIEEIVARWRLLTSFLRTRDMIVAKRLLAADDSTLVSEWSTPSGARGIEVWNFGPDGLVAASTLHGFLATGSDTSVRQSLRMLLSQPRTALTFAWLRLLLGRKR